MTSSKKIAKGTRYDKDTRLRACANQLRGTALRDDVSKVVRNRLYGIAGTIDKLAGVGSSFGEAISWSGKK